MISDSNLQTRLTSQLPDSVVLCRGRPPKVFPMPILALEEADRMEEQTTLKPNPAKVRGNLWLLVR